VSPVHAVKRSTTILVLSIVVVVMSASGAVAVPDIPRSPTKQTATSFSAPDGATPDFGARSGSSADVAVTGWGDSAGYHVEVAREVGDFTWREVALLHPAGVDDRSWVGYQCVSGDGRYAAVTVLPVSAVNVTAARDHGALAYSVDLQSGVVRPIAAAVGLKYHSPGCGTGGAGVFTANPGVDERTTVVVTADLAAGKVTGRAMVASQVTSAVPAEGGVVGVVGQRLVRITPGDKAGKPARLLAAPGAAYDLRPAADGGIDFMSLAAGATTAVVWHERGGAVTRVASGPAARLRVFQGRAGRSVVTGATEASVGAAVVRVDDGGLPRGAQFSSLDGDALYGPQSDMRRTDPAVLATRTRRLLTRPNAASGGVSARTLPAVTSTGAPTRRAPLAVQTPTCGVPRLDATRQSLQPNAAQVNWAVQMAAQNLLTGSLGRPAGYANMGLAAYAANSDFPKTALSHPAGDSWDSVPGSVMEAILAQESNWSQASWHALPGLAGDPLIASYYGVVDSINSINYANADCGYGIAQVTSGMAASDTSISPHGKAKVAVDYEENIAAGLEILQDKWNQLYMAGIIANDGNPRYLENWYFAAWAYNTGIQPTAAFGNTTGCTPGPSCTGPDGTWGLGWANNPRNPDYPPNRPLFLQITYADAAHPSQWPYQERIMGWMGSPLLRVGSPAYPPATYHGGSTWLNIPGINTFCTAANLCNSADGSGAYCTLADFECWWHTPTTWVTCSTSCATSAYTAGIGSIEPAVSDPHPPTCALDTSKVPNTGNGPPIIVDDQPTPVDLVGCGASNWSSNGTFTYTYGSDVDGNPTGAIDTHQLGAGLGGHILFTHTEDGTDPRVVNTGRWTPNLPKLQYYKLKLHFPATGASATNVVYKVFPGGGVSPWKIRVNQHWESEQWVTIGTFAMQNGGYVELSNTSTDTAAGSINYAEFDVGYDAIAFVQMGGTPGQPIGGPPNVIDAPKGSNPAWVQCGCVRRTAGDPVDTSTGYFGQTFSDLSTPGRGVTLTFTRTYASALADPAGPNGPAAINGPFGFGWTFSYNLSAVTDTTTGNVTVKQEDGSQVPFVNSAGGYAPAVPRFDATLTKNDSTYTYTRRSQQIYTFDTATGRLLSETNLPGTKANPPYATTLAYDASGHLSTITDPAARRYTLTWTGAHITGLADTAGRQVSYGYDTAGNLTDVYGVGTTRSPAPQNDDHTVYTYTPTHLLASMREPVAYGSTATPTPVVSMAYDNAERVTSQTDPLGHTTTFTYGPNSAANLLAGQTQVADPVGHKTVDTYQNGLLVSETKGAGTADAGTWSYTYDPVSLGITSVTDPNGNLQTFTYDDHGNQISASDARGYTTNRVYDDLDNLVTTIDPNGLQTSYGRDEAGHITTASGSNDGRASYGLLTSVTQQQLGQLAEIPDGNPSAATVRTTNFYYDDAAHPADLTRSVNPRGNTTTSTYDTAGDLTSTKDAENNTTAYGYDTGRGLRTSSVSPVGVAAGLAPDCTPPATGCTTYSHDSWGNLTATTDPLGHTTSTTYDADGNKTTTTDGNGHKTTYTYDLSDRQTTITRPDTTMLTTHYNPDNTVADTINAANQKTAYGYDGQARRTTRTDPDQRTTTWKYDPAGRLLSVTNAANQVTSYGYDPAGHQTMVAYSDTTTPDVTATTYDGDGRRTSTTDGGGTRTWSYDTFGEVVTQFNGAGAVVGYTYDADGNVTSITYPGVAGAVTRTFDKDDRLATVRDWNGKTTSFGYDADSNQNATMYPNRTTATVTLNNADQQTATTLNAGTTTLASLTSPRDAAGQISGETPTSLPGSAQTFAYNSLEQLGSTTTGGATTSYTYNTADEPTTIGTATQTFDTAGQICWSTTSTPPSSPACASPPAGATTYTYDAQGNRTTATTGTTVITDTYDQAGRLTQFAKPGVSARYTYDGTGLRTSKTVGSTSTQYTWDTTAATLLYDGTTAYLYGPSGLPIEQISASATQWYFHDQLGSTRALTDATGTVVAGYSYTPWGAVISHTGSASTPLQFTGQYTDAESGLIYLRARYYDPSTAQFLTKDPALDITRSPYGYTGDNPLNATDPSGLCDFWCGAIIGAVVAAVVVGTVACIIIEPCGLAEVGALAVAGGGVAGGALIPVGVGTAVGAGAAAGLAGATAGATIAALASGDGRSSSGSTRAGCDTARFGDGGARAPKAPSQRNVDGGTFKTRDEAWAAAQREEANYSYARTRAEDSPGDHHVHLDIYNNKGELLETRHYNYHQQG
jgi:RHS repeat-associated protein